MGDCYVFSNAVPGKKDCVGCRVDFWPEYLEIIKINNAKPNSLSLSEEDIEDKVFWCGKPSFILQMEQI